MLLVVLEPCLKLDDLFQDFQEVFSNLKYYNIVNLYSLLTYIHQEANLASVWLVFHADLWCSSC